MPPMRDDRPEKERYRRASLAEQIGGELATLRHNRPLIWLLVALVGGWAILTITRPENLEVARLGAGDCLYIRAADADTDSPTGRPIGSEAAAVTALFDSGAERAPCTGSHSHEVAEAFMLDEEPLAGPYPGQGALADRYRDRCEAAFATHVGRATEGSSLSLIVAIPTPRAWERGARAGACLVARADGRFLPGPARGSGL